MGKLILTTTMTVDALTDVGAWYVAEGEHDRAARAQFEAPAAMLLGRKTFEGLAAYWSATTGEWAGRRAAPLRACGLAADPLDARTRSRCGRC